MEPTRAVIYLVVQHVRDTRYWVRFALTVPETGMARLIAAIMRHGAYDQPAGVPSAHLPHPLTKAGETDARAGARELAETAAREGWCLHPVIDSSSLLRAWQTAHIVAETLPGPVSYRVEAFDALAERSLGAAANLTLDEIAAATARDPRLGPLPISWRSDSAFRLPFIGAESLIEAGARVARHLRERMQALICDRADGIVKLFVGHGAALRHAAAELGALDLAGAAARSMHYGRPVFLEATGQRSWRHVAGEWKMQRESAARPA